MAGKSIDSTCFQPGDKSRKGPVKLYNSIIHINAKEL